MHPNDNDTLTDRHEPPPAGAIDRNDVLDVLDEVGYKGVYNTEVSLGCFGDELMTDTAAVSVKIVRVS